MQSILQEEGLALLQGLVFAVVTFAALWIARAVASASSRAHYDADHEVEEAANLAAALRQGGLYVGLAVGMLGALSGGGRDFAGDLLELSIDGACLLVLLFVARAVTDRVVVHGVRIDAAIAQGNVAVGIVEACVLVATGLVANGSFAGQGGGLASALVFFVLGQLALLLLALAYEFMTAFEVIREVREGNTAAGLMLGGMLVAFGLILEASISGPFVAWSADLSAFAVSAAAGLLLLLLLQWPIDRLFLPGMSLAVAIEERKNTAAIAVAVSVKVALALVIGAVLI